jgi:catechol 2,3-dioxygenase-like lactoylglutathione lyase family enzyme
MSIKRINPNIRSERFEESREFYRDVIGLVGGEGLDWILFFSSPNDPKLQLSVMRLDVTAGVHPEVTIEVDDVDAVHARAVASGAEIVHPLTDEPWNVRRFFVRDPNGAVINVMQHR